MLWCGNTYLRGNRVSKSRFIQQNLKKFKGSSLPYKPKYTEKKNLKNPKHNHQIWGKNIKIQTLWFSAQPNKNSDRKKQKKEQKKERKTWAARRFFFCFFLSEQKKEQKKERTQAWVACDPGGTRPGPRATAWVLLVLF